jgi:hypothetical protein
MLRISRLRLVALLIAMLLLILHRPIASYFCNIAAPFGVLDSIACPVYFGAFGLRSIAIAAAATLGLLVVAIVAKQGYR